MAGLIASDGGPSFTFHGLEGCVSLGSSAASECSGVHNSQECCGGGVVLTNFALLASCTLSFLDKRDHAEINPKLDYCQACAPTILQTRNRPYFSGPVHDKSLSLFRTYLCLLGMPE